MPAKKPKFQNIIICDDIRQEIGNKMSYMGIYKSKIIIPQEPFTFPKLCFAITYKDIKASDSFSINLYNPEGKKIGDGIKAGPSPEPYKGYKKLEMMGIFSPLNINKAGKYILKIKFNDDPELKKEIKIEIEVAS